MSKNHDLIFIPFQIFVPLILGVILILSIGSGIVGIFKFSWWAFSRALEFSAELVLVFLKRFEL